MNASYRLARELGVPDMKSDYWRELLAEGRQEYGGKGNFIEQEELWAGFRSNVITKGLDNANVPPEALDRMHAKWERMYREIRPQVPEGLRPFFEESPIGSPSTLEVDGFHISQSSLEYTFMLTHLAPYLAHASVVVDIGGGYGGLARLIKLAFPSIRLVLLDLPEVNAIQTYFLMNAFPDGAIVTLAELGDRPSIDPMSNDPVADFLVLPGPFMERLVPGSYQLVINTRSMMEMDAATVGFYIEHIQRSLAHDGFFYCVNRYEKKTRLKDYPFDDRWYVSYSKPWPSYIDPNPHHEIVAGRAGAVVMEGLREHVLDFPPYDSRWKKMRKTLTLSAEPRSTR